MIYINSEFGYLNIRCSSANNALPISNVKIIVSRTINNNKKIFFEGVSDSSGSISNIKLPAPMLGNDEDIPAYEEYDVEAIYNGNKLVFKVNIYANIKVLQNINIVPTMESI